MFRTRDFLLISLTIGFLLVAITATVTSKWSRGGEAGQFAPQTAPPTEYTAVVYEEPEPVSREERLVDMRAKIAARTTISASTELELAEVVPDTPTDAAVVDGEQMSPMRCASYQPYTGAWPRSGVELEVTEGARLVFEEGALEVPAGTSSAPVTIARSVLLQLPISLLPASVPSCLSSDVVGIAKDGSLIRNNEVGLYGIFGSETVVGYALDGFPIYGVSTERTDQCGGAIVAGQYGYYLSAERSEILHCFAGQPVAL